MFFDEGDDIEDSSCSEQAQAVPTALRGTVVIKFPPSQEQPPDDSVLVDPSTLQSLLRLAVKLETGERARVLMWGVWSDRASDLIQKADVLTITGATVKHHADAPPGERLAITLPPSGAPPSAAVVVESAKRRTKDKITLQGIAKCGGVDATTSAHAAVDGGGGGAATGAAQGAAGGRRAGTSGVANDGRGGTKRLRGGSKYDYEPLASLPLHSDGSDGGRRDRNCFGVVLDYTLPQSTRGFDLRSEVRIVDETCSTPDDALAVCFFKAHPVPPGIGSVVRFHRIRTSGEYDGIKQASAVNAQGRCLSSWVFNLEEVIGPPGSATHTWGDSDAHRVADLQSWARDTLSQPSSALALALRRHDVAAADATTAAAASTDPHACTTTVIPPLMSLAQAEAAAAANTSGGDRCFDVLARVSSIGSRVVELCTSPSRHGFVAAALGAQQPLALLTLVDPPHARPQQPPLPGQAEAAAPAGVAVWLSSTLSAAVADALRRSVMEAVGPEYDGSWVKIRNVQLEWRAGGLQAWRNQAAGNSSSHAAAARIALVYGSKSSLTRIPDYHAAVQPPPPPPPPQAPPQAAPRHQPRSAVPPPLPQPQSDRAAAAGTATAASDLVEQQPPARAIALLPPGVGREALPAGAHGAECTRPPSDLHVESLQRHQKSGSLQPPAGPLRPLPQQGHHNLPWVLAGLLGGSRQQPPPPQQQQSLGPVHAAPLTCLAAADGRPPEGSPLMTLREAIEHACTSAPCQLRVRARVKRALPDDPLLWTADVGGGGGHVYRMVLHLCDPDDENVYIGAVLCGDDAENFFLHSGLRAADLTKSNVTLQALRRRVAVLAADTAQPCEFSLWACRPNPSKRDAHDVAYHIFDTQLMVEDRM